MEIKKFLVVISAISAIAVAGCSKQQSSQTKESSQSKVSSKKASKSKKRRQHHPNLLVQLLVNQLVTERGQKRHGTQLKISNLLALCQAGGQP